MAIAELLKKIGIRKFLVPIAVENCQYIFTYYAVNNSFCSTEPIKLSYYYLKLTHSFITRWSIIWSRVLIPLQKI